MSKLTVVGAILFAIIAFVSQQIYRDHWHNRKDLNRADFDHDAQFTQLDIPTTYYSKGQLKNKLDSVRDFKAVIIFLLFIN